MKIKILGVGNWGIETPVKVEKNEIIFKVDDFKEMMDKIAETHDTVGGGFFWETKEDK